MIQNKSLRIATLAVVALALISTGSVFLPQWIGGFRQPGVPVEQRKIEAYNASGAHAENGMYCNTLAYNGGQERNKRTDTLIRLERRVTSATSGSDRYVANLWSKCKAAARRLWHFLVRRDIRASGARDQRKISFYLYRNQRESGFSQSDSNSGAHVCKERLDHPLLDK